MRASVAVGYDGDAALCPPRSRFFSALRPISPSLWPSTIHWKPNVALSGKLNDLKDASQRHPDPPPVQRLRLAASLNGTRFLSVNRKVRTSLSHHHQTPQMYAGAWLSNAKANMIHIKQLGICCDCGEMLNLYHRKLRLSVSRNSS